MGLARQLLDDAPDRMLFMHRRYGYSSTTHFLEAIGSGHVPLVQLFLDNNAEVNHFPLGARETPLQRAARGGHLGVVGLLLERGADVNALPALKRGSTALQAAAASGSLSVMKKLLEHGANLYMPPAAINGAGPLEEAASHARFDMIDFLWSASRYCGRRFDQAQIAMSIAAARNFGYHGCADRLEELMHAWPEGELAPASKSPFNSVVTEDTDLVTDFMDFFTHSRDDGTHWFPGGYWSPGPQP